VEIQLDAFADERFPGRVYMIVPTADRSKATVMTKVKFDRLDPRILPQMSAKAAFLSRPLREGEDQPFLGIPVSSVMHSNGNNAVYRINQGRAHAVRIQTGRSWGDTVEVVRGLKDGDIVALKPTRNLGDGTRVKVLE
jgi:multidrug efflux pump subunit AcrA (membrane-fusion protein)